MFSDGPLKLLRFLRLDALPSFFDLRICYTVLNRRYVGRLRPEGDRRCHHFELVALQGLTVVRFRIGRRTNRKFNLLDVLIGIRRYGLNRRPEIIDHIVVGDNVSDVPCLADDLNVPLRWLDIRGIARFVPMRIADKRVSSRSNAIIGVGPRRYGSVPR